MYCQEWQGVWFALDVENWSEEGTIRRVGLLLLLRRTQELSSYVSTKPVFHTLWEVASPSLSRLFNWSDTSGAGQVLRRNTSLLKWVCSVKWCSMCSSCLCSLEVVWFLLFILWEVVCSQAVSFSDCHPVPPGQTPFPTGSYFLLKVIFLSVLAAFHCTFADSTLSNQHHCKAIQN